MKIAIYGAGYVGLTAGVCLADLGHHVLMMDTDAQKIKRLQAGESPVFEPGLSEYLQRNLKSKRLNFTSDIEKTVAYAEIQVIAVGTPSTVNGAADLSYISQVAENIGRYMNGYRLIVNKSTVPVGTAQAVKKTIQDQLKKRHVQIEFDVVANPEFLKQGAAIQDFMKPDRIIIGVENQRAENMMRELYVPLDDTGQRLIIMDIPSSELTKYAANAFLATKISFINEISQIAERIGANIDKVRIGLGSDSRISPMFLSPGCGFGGSCFPKDVRALQVLARQHGVQPLVLQAVEAVNQRQKRILFDKISAYFEGELKGKVIALWGLAFKPGTDDMREASSCVLMEALWSAGAKVQAFDPVAQETARRLYGQRADLLFCNELEETLKNADVLAIVTEWEQFKNPDFTQIKICLRYPAVFDGRNLFTQAQLAAYGLTYYSIGRGEENPLQLRAPQKVAAS